MPVALAQRCRVIGIMALLLAASLHEARAQSSGGLQPSPLGRLVDVGGYRVHLYCIGRGSPTVVITGAGASFDWGLVQPEVAKDTQVCAYDHSGTAWSDPGPQDACSLRVRELHAALRNAGVAGPFVLVGHSLGALVSRLYAATYEDDVAGMVIVDHAANFPVRNMSLPAQLPVQSAPSLPIGRIPPGESVFQKLPAREYALHQWAGSLPSAASVLRNNPSLLSGCTSEVEARTRERVHPLKDKPLIVLYTNSGDVGQPAGASPYMQLQESLAALTTNSVKVRAEESSHYIMIDRPDLVISAIRRVVNAVRSRSRLGTDPPRRQPSIRQ